MRPRNEGDQRKPGDSSHGWSHRTASFQSGKNSLDESIRQIETRPATEADLEAVTSALQRLDPIWEVLYPEEQRRVLELLVDEIDVGKTVVTVQFRIDGIEQIATELQPIGERNGRASAQ